MTSKDTSTKINIYDDLSKKYKDILFSSLVTSFGLDAILFANDQKGGNVDTVNNARNNVWTRDSANKKEYDASEKYGKEISHDYHSNKAYIDKGKEFKQLKENGKLVDQYTGKEIKNNDQFDRDHIISAKEIHNDAGRSLSGLNGVDLANSDSNLAPTDSSINRSKKDLSAQKFIEKLKREKKQSIEKLSILNNKTKLTDKERKQKATLESKLSVDEKLIQEADTKARSEYNTKVAQSYYFDKKFLGPAAKDVFNTGLKMGLRQGVGVVLMELSFAIQQEIPVIMDRWSKLTTWKEKLDLKPMLDHVIRIFNQAWEKIKNKFQHIWNATKDGFMAGAISAVVTTVINIFKTTAKNILRMIRNFWSAITSSLRIIVSNPDNLSAEDKVAAIIKIIAVALGGILQPIIAEGIKAMVIGVPFLSPVMSYISEFVSAALSGILSVSLVYIIDNSPLVKKIVAFARKVGEISSEVIKYISEVSQIAYGALISCVNQIEISYKETLTTLTLQRENIKLLSQVSNNMIEGQKIFSSFIELEDKMNHFSSEKEEEKQEITNNMINAISRI